jgi:aspartate kinase
MKVFKFGGTSIRNAPAIQNVASIIQSYSDEKLLIVVSAMGQTTDVLEQIVALQQSRKNTVPLIGQLREFHRTIIRELFGERHAAYAELEEVLEQIQIAATQPGEDDQLYDQVVSLGEVISSLIVNHYLSLKGINSVWVDARLYIKTDSRFREGKIDWEETRNKIQTLKPIVAERMILTQGFIGSTRDGLTTTLGREGSDFSAAIFAACLDAASVTIWKDVAGVMNADPKRLPTAALFEELPFKEAAEMTYYGASIIHPKTIKPLANKGIPLHVKSFLDPSLEGTIIHECVVTRLPPLIVFKENQCLISCQVTDYSFINEQQIGIIFQTLSEHNIKINVMQNSAISFSFCVDFRENKILKLIDQLGRNFEVYYNTGLTLITVKNYDAGLHQEYRNRPGVILEQLSRSTFQVLVKSSGQMHKHIGT